VHKSRSLLLSLGVGFVFAASPAMFGASFIVPTDRELVDSAKAIVIATATTSYSVRTSDDFIDTVFEFRVEEVIKGAIDLHVPLQLVEGGGALNGHYEMVPEAPRYRTGERALIFTGTNKRGESCTLDMTLGKFNFVHDLHGRQLLLRGADDGEIFGWDASGNRHEEPIRNETEFLDFVRAATCGNLASENYVVPRAEVAFQLKPASNANAAGFHAADYQQLVTGSGGIRWQNIFDQPGGSGSVTFQTVGTEAGVPNAMGGIDQAMGAWNNDSLSNVHYIRGAATSVGFADDGISSIHLDDNTDVPSGAVGFTRYYGGNTYMFDGGLMAATTNADVAIKAGFTSNQTLYVEVLTHELGHSLSFRHSGDRAPATSQAIMNAVSSGAFGSTLQQWDRDAVETVYNPNPGGGACISPSITTQPQSQSIAFGASANLSVTASGSSPFTYQWYIGSSGDASNPIPGATNSTVTVSPTVTTSYWVKVSNSCTPNVPANSNTATVAVQPCQPPNIITQPQDQTVPSGSTAQLSVGFNGTAPITVTWFKGSAPDTSQGSIGSGATVTTPPITASSMFWARLQNSCGGPVNTRTVTVTAGACTPPTINNQPQDQTVTSGGTVVLNVGFSGRGATVSWFQGTSGDTSSGVIATGPTTISPPINATTSFWARITGCGQSVNSRTAMITVSNGCVAPSIATDPANQTIGSGSTVTLTVVAGGTAPLHYAWFRGASGDESNSVGTDADTFTSGALTAAAQFWVKVTNTCGTAKSGTASITVAVGRKHAVRRR
jgi:hypothetical protein